MYRKRSIFSCSDFQAHSSFSEPHFSLSCNWRCYPPQRSFANTCWYWEQRSSPPPVLVWSSLASFASYGAFAPSAQRSSFRNCLSQASDLFCGRCVWRALLTLSFLSLQALIVSWVFSAPTFSCDLRSPSGIFHLRKWALFKVRALCSFCLSLAWKSAAGVH